MCFYANAYSSKRPTTIRESKYSSASDSDSLHLLSQSSSTVSKQCAAFSKSTLHQLAKLGDKPRLCRRVLPEAVSVTYDPNILFLIGILTIPTPAALYMLANLPFFS